MQRALGALAIVWLTTAMSATGAATDPLDSPEAMAELRQRVAAGDLVAMDELGYYLQNDPDDSNDIEGRDLLIAAAEGGRWQSAASLGQHYLYGWGEWARVDGEGNTKEGLHWMRRAGEMVPADEEGQHIYAMLGALYAHAFMRGIEGPPPPRDGAEAIRWYRLCAAETAACGGPLGRLLITNPDTAKEGIEWLLTAANRADGWSMRELGDLYAEGTILRRDPVMALAWYRRAAAWTPEASEGNDLVLDARRKAETLEQQLSAEEIQRANDLAAAFKPWR